MVKELEYWLVKIQDVFGTPNDDLDETDYFPALPDSNMEVIPAFTDIETVSAIFDQDIAVRGFVNVNADLSCYMRSLGYATEPDYGKLAKAAGFEVDLTDGIYTYTQILAPTTKSTDDLSVWHCSGGIGANASILRKAGNIVGDWKISGEVGKPPIFSLVGAKGVYVSEAADTSIYAIIVKDRSLIPAVLPLTVSINGVAYKVLKFEFTGGCDVQQYIDCAETYGFGQSEMAKKKTKFSFTCYADAGLANPLDAVIAGAVVEDVSLTWGITAKKTNLLAEYPLFRDCKTVDSGGLTAWDVTGDCTQNNFSIIQNSDYVAE